MCLHGEELGPLKNDALISRSLMCQALAAMQAAPETAADSWFQMAGKDDVLATSLWC